MVNGIASIWSLNHKNGKRRTDEHGYENKKNADGVQILPS